MMSRGRIVGVVAVATAVLGVGLALAATVRVVDPDDTRGVLDVREVRLDLVSGQPPAWTIITTDTWRIPSLWDRGYFFVEIDANNTPEADHYVLIRSDGRAMRADLFRVVPTAAKDYRVGALTVWRTADDRVSVKVPLSWIKFGPYRTFYRWWVVTSLMSKGCPDGCIDRAPDAGAITQYRPGMSPTPTPSPTASTAPPAEG